MDELTLLVILSVSLLLGLFLTIRYGAKCSLTNPNFASWYFFIEFFLMSALSTYSISSVYKSKWALRFIPKAEFPFQEVVLTLSWCAIAIPIGYLIANLLLSKMKLESSYEVFQHKKIQKSESINIFFFFWIAISLIVLIFTIYQIGFIPQLRALTLNGESIALLRGQLTHQYPSSPHLKELIGMHLLPMLTFMSLARLTLNKKSLDLVIFVFFLLSSIFFASINLNKSGVAFIALGLFFTIVIVKNGIKIKYLIISSTFLIFLIFGAYKLTYQNQDLKLLSKGIFSRVVYSQTYGNYLSFYVFPRLYPHIGFSSISKQIQKLGFEYKEPASRTMMRVADAKRVEQGAAGFMVSAFFAEAWANWGIVGVILSPLFIGFLIKFLVGITISLPKTALSIGFLSFLSFKLAIFAGINHLIFPRYLLISIILLYSSYKFSLKIGRIKCLKTI